jgi:D-beta-D-heptose 7-phosphate kinase / D-beta-D-heptose 1-phosphate adenosyltransferase
VTPAELLAAATGAEVLVIGDAMLDTTLVGSSNRLCQEAPVPIVDVDERETAAGGAGNVAANVAALGGRAHLISVTGADPESRTLRERLTDAGVDAVDVFADDRRATLMKERVVSDGHLLLRVDRGSTDAISSYDERTLLDALRTAWEPCAAVVVSDYGYGVMTPAVIDAIGELQRESPRTLVVDAKDVARYRHVGASVAKPNYGQALALLGEPPVESRPEQIERSIDRLFDVTGARIIVVTLDQEGALAFERDRSPFRTYARPTRMVQAAGAGDAFAAALAVAFGAGASMPAAVELASAASAVVVSTDRTSVCSAADIRQMMSGGDKLVASAGEAANRVEFLRRQGQRIVFTNGCFDLLHRGHVTYLSRAKALGDLLVVAVNTDAGVRALKGSDRPINPLEDRMEVLAALSCVDLVVAFDEPTPERLIAALRPDVFVKGGDYTVDMLPEAGLVERLGGTVHILPYVEDRSTTGLLRRIRSDHADHGGYPAEVA